MEDNQPDNEAVHAEAAQFLSLSDAAFFGISSVQTLRVKGSINGKPVTILVDCGSTHNIIQPRIASGLNLPKNDIEPFSVMVGNGQMIRCSRYCPTVPLQIQQLSFNIPLFILPIEGADLVLGISWLGSLGRLTADFSVPEISFIKDGATVTLKGEPLAQPISPSSLSTLIRHGSIASIHTLVMQNTTPNNQTTVLPTHLGPTVNTLLHTFTKLFQEPHT